MNRVRLILPILTLLMSGCAAGPSDTLRAAANSTCCPVGTVRVCESLFEPGREIRPNPCGCADLAGRR